MSLEKEPSVLLAWPRIGHLGINTTISVITAWCQQVGLTVHWANGLKFSWVTKPNQLLQEDRRQCTGCVIGSP